MQSHHEERERKDIRALDILLEPLDMPNLTFKNGSFTAPMGTTFSKQRLTDFPVSLARAEIACITTGLIRVHPTGSTYGSDEPSLASSLLCGLGLANGTRPAIQKASRGTSRLSSTIYQDRRYRS